MGGARAWERGSPFSDLVPSKGQRPPVSPCRKPVKSLCDCGDRHDALEMFPRQGEGCPPGTRPQPRSKRSCCTLLVSDRGVFLEQRLRPQRPDRFNYQSRNISSTGSINDRNNLERRPREGPTCSKVTQPGGQSCH